MGIFHYKKNSYYENIFKFKKIYFNEEYKKYINFKLY
jgi:hypothetical protein